MVLPLRFATSAMFLADRLSRCGIRAYFIQVSPYTSAADPLTKSKMSPELGEQLTWLLESQYEELVRAIAGSRSLDAAGAKRRMDGLPYGGDLVAAPGVADLVSPGEVALL